MAAPAWQATGTLATSTGAISPNWPTHLTDDIGLLIINHNGTAAPTLSPAAGFVLIADIDAASAKSGSIWWCRATSASMTAPTCPDSGDGNAGLIMTVRGCVTSGDPWDVFGEVAQASTASISIDSITTTLDELLLVTATFAAHGVNDSTALIQSQTITNSYINSIDVRHDSASGLNNDGYCLSIITGPTNTIGTTGPMTWTSAIAARAVGHIMVALKSPDSDAGGGGGTIPGRISLKGVGL